MNKKRPTYLSLLNLLGFLVFFVSLWFFSFNIPAAASVGIGRIHLEMLILQSVSFLLALCAAQMPGKSSPVLRCCLLSFSFVALAESALVALLSPVG